MLRLDPDHLAGVGHPSFGRSCGAARCHVARRPPLACVGWRSRRAPRAPADTVCGDSTVVSRSGGRKRGAAANGCDCYPGPSRQGLRSGRVRTCAITTRSKPLRRMEPSHEPMAQSPRRSPRAPASGVPGRRGSRRLALVPAAMGLSWPPCCSCGQDNGRIVKIALIVGFVILSLGVHEAAHAVGGAQVRGHDGAGPRAHHAQPPDPRTSTR